MWVGFSLVNGCVTTLKSFFFPSKTIQAVTPIFQTWFLHVAFMECGWDSDFFLAEVALIGHLYVKAVTGKDSCPGRSWLALTLMHCGAPLASWCLTGGGYGCAGTLGSFQKFIKPLCFSYYSLCSAGEPAEFSSVSAPVFQCLQPWGAGLSEILP